MMMMMMMITQAKELKAATRVIQSSSNELSTQVPDRIKNVNERKLIAKFVKFMGGRRSPKRLSSKVVGPTND